jgi:hypothetical protein
MKRSVSWIPGGDQPGEFEVIARKEQ